MLVQVAKYACARDVLQVRGQGAEHRACRRLGEEGQAGGDSSTADALLPTLCTTHHVCREMPLSSSGPRPSKHLPGRP